MTDKHRLKAVPSESFKTASMGMMGINLGALFLRRLRRLRHGALLCFAEVAWRNTYVEGKQYAILSLWACIKNPSMNLT
jgi:hypothetical protein